MKLPRGSGILMHITSLPGRHGIGDLGQGAYDFVDFLAAAGQKYWQFLPLGPVSRAFNHSPYTTLSAFAGNVMMVDLDQLVERGLLEERDLSRRPEFPEYHVGFDMVYPFKKNLLKKAFQNFISAGKDKQYTSFCKKEQYWLDDYALFMALRKQNNYKGWHEWPRGQRLRQEKALAACRRELAGQIEYYRFQQFCFHTQWRRLHAYAGKKKIHLVGDIPIYVGGDSADVWCHPGCFSLDVRTHKPTHVAGVPPDYFSETGQRWGNPLYRWKKKDGRPNDELYEWWRHRFKVLFETVDICRIDHFRGFEAYWQIPAKEKTAINGKWVKGPGRGFFKEMEATIGDLPIIAEDLGLITPEVEELRDELGLPGMKVLQFAFDSDPDNAYLPHNFKTPNCVVYTGTHDNDTSLGWYMSDKGPEESKASVRRYAHSDGHEIHWDFVRLALSSIADMAIIPMQDILGFGNDCRMNAPGTTKGNWRWRLAPKFLSDEVRDRLRDETEFYGRK